MARERMVTRTITATTITAMVVNTANRAVENMNFEVLGKLDEKETVKYINKVIPDGYVFVQIVERKTSEKLYGMTEEDFIRMAVELPPRSVAE